MSPPKKSDPVQRPAEKKVNTQAKANPPTQNPAQASTSKVNPPQKQQIANKQDTRQQQQQEIPPANAFQPDKYVKANCPRDEVIELKKAFDIFDEDASGTIDPKELTTAFELMGMHTQSTLIYQVLGELDQDNSGGIDFDEFFKLATTKQVMKNTRQDISRAFSLFDANSDGKISFEELKKVSHDLGEYESDDAVRNMFSRADLDKDGFVTFEDFYKIMSNDKVYWG